MRSESVGVATRLGHMRLPGLDGTNAAMGRLHRRERTARRLADEGLSWAEIGRALGIKADTARRDVERSRNGFN